MTTGASLVTTPGHLAVYDNSGRKLWIEKTDLVVSVKIETNGLPGHHGPGVAIYASHWYCDDRTKEWSEIGQTRGCSMMRHRLQWIKDHFSASWKNTGTLHLASQPE